MRYDQYKPPPIDQADLTAKLFDSFAVRKQWTKTGSFTRPTLQVIELVRAYMNWWMLMSAYPDLHIICTPPIWVVRRVHASPEVEDRVQFVRASFSYLGRVPKKEDVFSLRTKNKSVLETAYALQEHFGDNPGLAWEPILLEAKRIKQGDIIRF